MKLTSLISIASLTLASKVASEVLFKEGFDDDSWTQRWTISNHKDDYGVMKLATGKYFGDAAVNQGLQTSQDARYYSYSAPFDKPFNNQDKDLVFQYTLKHEQGIDCGGGYLKLLPEGTDAKDFNGDSKYYVMFGNDVCGGTRNVHAIFNYNGKNVEMKKKISPPSDELTHLYTLIVKPDQTYQILIDEKEEASGNLLEDWDFLPPKTIKDPEAKKPDDWDEREKIPDPLDVKPEGYDDIKATIPDPERLTAPEDWDTEMDGDYLAPEISNPEYKGPWKAKTISNPDYKGQWIHPEIANPEYQPDETIGKYSDLGAVGIDLWQVKSGSIFDNVLVTDDVAYAKEYAQETWGKYRDQEKALKEKADEDGRKQMEEEQKKREEESKTKSNKDEDEDLDVDEELDAKIPKVDKVTPDIPMPIKDEL